MRRVSKGKRRMCKERDHQSGLLGPGIRARCVHDCRHELPQTWTPPRELIGDIWAPHCTSQSAVTDVPLAAIHDRQFTTCFVPFRCASKIVFIHYFEKAARFPCFEEDGDRSCMMMAEVALMPRLARR